MTVENFSSSDIKFLKLTLKLAKKGQGFTSPNPMVGAVIVKNGKIIGQGYHKKYGGPHAEIEALNSAKKTVAGATMYVSLEPHGFQGVNTPPCTKAIINAKIKKVVCCTLDPNHKVAGNGIEQLRQAGIETKVGALEKEAQDLNCAFFTYHQKQRPLVAIKFASSLDGKIATKTHESKWITGEAARKFARSLRSQYQAILVGINTVLADDPNLGVRNKNQKDPIRVIIDSSLKIPLNAQVLRDKNVLIFTTISANKKKKQQLIKLGFKIIEFKNKFILPKQILSKLHEQRIISLFIEGGSQTLGNFVDAKLVDKIYAFQAPKIIGGNDSLSAIGGQGITKLNGALQIKEPQFKKIDNDFLIFGDVI